MNPELKKVIRTFIIFVIIFGEWVTISIQDSKNKNLERSIEQKNEYIKSMETNQILALQILSTGDTWYIVNKDTISTEPNGQGTVIGLDKSILAKGTRLHLDHPDKNKKIKFVVKGSEVFGTGYTVCGGLLSYYYTL